MKNFRFILSWSVLISAGFLNSCWKKPTVAGEPSITFASSDTNAFIKVAGFRAELMSKEQVEVAVAYGRFFCKFFAIMSNSALTKSGRLVREASDREAGPVLAQLPRATSAEINLHKAADLLKESVFYAMEAMEGGRGWDDPMKNQLLRLTSLPPTPQHLRNGIFRLTEDLVCLVDPINCKENSRRLFADR